ncbi:MULTISPECIES: GAD-like domain-containing protein [unclassified Zymobacter]|uniref:GAD-like domain-containing protein n=1 Tax=unclassified Zymobacter TaxID=3048685 RepID=UPI0039C11F78
MMDVMDSGFISFYRDAGFGPINDTVCVPEAAIRYYEYRLPRKLIEYWRYWGWAGFADGLFWLVNPAEYEEVVALWLAGSPFEYRDRYHVIARSAFGELFLWGEKTADSLTIQTLFGQIFPADRSDDIGCGSSQNMNVLVQEFMATLCRSNLDILDIDNQPLFMPLRERLGSLRSDEMYGRAPAFIECAPYRIEHFARVHAIAHMTHLAKVGERHIMQDMGAVLKQSYLENLM